MLSSRGYCQWSFYSLLKYLELGFMGTFLTSWGQTIGNPWLVEFIAIEIPKRVVYRARWKYPAHILVCPRQIGFLTTAMGKSEQGVIISLNNMYLAKCYLKIIYFSTPFLLNSNPENFILNFGYFRRWLLVHSYPYISNYYALAYGERGWRFPHILFILSHSVLVSLAPLLYTINSFKFRCRACVNQFASQKGTLA